MTPKKTRQSNKKTATWVTLVWGLVFCATVLAGGAGVGYFTDRGWFVEPEPVELVSAFSFSGPVRPEHLSLSQSEILDLNRSAKRNEDVVEAVDVRMEIFTSRQDIAADDTLFMSMEFATRTGEVIQSRPQEIARRHLVDRMVRYTDLAGSEYRRFRGMGVEFSFLWI